MESKWIAGVLILAGLSAPAASAQESAAPSDGQLIYLEEVQATESAPAPKPKAPAGGPYKGVFYDNDFSYLDKPGAVKDDYYELLKRLRVAPGLVVDVGGEYRHQFKNEDRRSLFVGAPTNPRTDTYDLSRFRLDTDGMKTCRQSPSTRTAPTC
jgi:hypothetical protein